MPRNAETPEPAFHIGDRITYVMRDGTRLFASISGVIPAGISSRAGIVGLFGEQAAESWNFRTDAASDRYVLHIEDSPLQYTEIIRSTHFIDTRAIRL